jgi:hypothetical protein
MATEIISKRCSKCKQTKPTSKFTKHKSKKDGFRSWCKSCIKVYKKVYRQSERGKAAAAKHRTKYRKGPGFKAARHREIAKRNARNPNYLKAKGAVSNAIAAGKIPRVNIKFCHYCLKPAQHYHHWHGYEPEHWLDIVPACIKCHTKLHRKIA